MVYLHFPSQFTEEEEMLQKKYQKLKRKKKAFQQMKAPKQEPPPTPPLKRSIEAKQDAKEMAKKLLKSGAISAIKKEPKERQGFKRPKALERKRFGSDKPGGAVTGYHPFSSSHASDEDQNETSPVSGARPAIKNLYESFVSARDAEKRDGKEDKERETERPSRGGRPDPPREGNTIYVYGYGVTEQILRNGFAPFGNIINITMEMDKNCGFVTFEKNDSAKNAIKEVNGSMVSGVKLKVSMARKQPLIPPPSDGSSSSYWSNLAATNPKKISHNDKRELMQYNAMF